VAGSPAGFGGLGFRPRDLAPTQELAGTRDRLAGRLVVAGFPTATAALLPRAIARLTAVHPGFKVQLTEASTPAQLAALRRGRMEVAIVATGEGLPEYDLEGLRLTVLRSARSAGVAVAVAVAESHPFAVQERIEPTRLGLVAAGLGIALVPGIAAQAVPRGVRWIPVHDDTGGLRRAAWAATNDNPSAAATAMVHALEEEVSS
jgi:DNA-binding transcriptional LysR family regulator